MTDLPLKEALDAAQHLSQRDDRYAFFATLVIGAIVIGAGVVLAARYLVRQNRELIDALNRSHAEHAIELKGIVDRLQADMRDSTAARVAQTEVFRATAEVMRDATEELRIHRTLRAAAASPLGKA